MRQAGSSTHFQRSFRSVAPLRKFVPCGWVGGTSAYSVSHDQHLHPLSTFNREHGAKGPVESVARCQDSFARGTRTALSSGSRGTSGCSCRDGLALATSSSACRVASFRIPQGAAKPSTRVPVPADGWADFGLLCIAISESTGTCRRIGVDFARPGGEEARGSCLTFAGPLRRYVPQGPHQNSLDKPHPIWHSMNRVAMHKASPNHARHAAP